jgi:hypothetical protein
MDIDIDSDLGSDMDKVKMKRTDERLAGFVVGFIR